MPLAGVYYPALDQRTHAVDSAENRTLAAFVGQLHTLYDNACLLVLHSIINAAA